MGEPIRLACGNYGKSFNFLVFEYGVEYRLLEAIGLNSAVYSRLA
jgi:hypothetical protein